MLVVLCVPTSDSAATATGVVKATPAADAVVGAVDTDVNTAGTVTTAGTSAVASAVATGEVDQATPVATTGTGAVIANLVAVAAAGIIAGAHKAAPDLFLDTEAAGTGADTCRCTGTAAVILLAN